MRGNGALRERSLMALWQNCKFRDGFGNLVLGELLLYKVVTDVLTITPVRVEVLAKDMVMTVICCGRVGISLV